MTASSRSGKSAPYCRKPGEPCYKDFFLFVSDEEAQKARAFVHVNLPSIVKSKARSNARSWLTLLADY